MKTGTGIASNSDSDAAVPHNLAEPAPVFIKPVHRCMKIGIFLPNWLGDLVMATPALRAIREHFGRQANIVGILRPKLAETLAGTDWLSEQWLFDPRGQEPKWRRWALVRRMRQERFDIVLLLTNSLHTAILAWLGRAKERIGYVRYGRGPLLTGRLYPRRHHGRIVPAPMVESYLALAESLGCRCGQAESRRLELATTEAEEVLGDRIWRDLGLRNDGRVIALNCSGAYGAAKLWPLEHCGRLARRIASELEYDALVLCGPGEAATAREIQSHAQHPRVFSLADQPLGLAASKACLRRSRLLVTTDSGPQHIAAALGKPVVTLLGPTRSVWIENPTVRSKFVSLDLDCLGCAKRVCPLQHHRCMRDLSVEMVFDAVVKLMRNEG
jgi:heptosyltransferase II